jgi:hypothetical protein
MIEPVLKGKGKAEEGPSIDAGVINPDCYEWCQKAGHPCGSQSLNGFDYAIGVSHS